MRTGTLQTPVVREPMRSGKADGDAADSSRQGADAHSQRGWGHCGLVSSESGCAPATRKGTLRARVRSPSLTIIAAGPPAPPAKRALACENDPAARYTGWAGPARGHEQSGADVPMRTGTTGDPVVRERMRTRNAEGDTAGSSPISFAHNYRSGVPLRRR